MQDVIPSATYWLQACGIFEKILDDYMNAEPLIPLPKQRPNTGLEPVELLKLFLLWAVGMTLAILAFLAEVMLGVKAKHRVTTQNGLTTDMIYLS